MCFFQTGFLSVSGPWSGEHRSTRSTPQPVEEQGPTRSAPEKHSGQLEGMANRVSCHSRRDKAGGSTSVACRRWVPTDPLLAVNRPLDVCCSRGKVARQFVLPTLVGARAGHVFLWANIRRSSLLVYMEQYG